MTATATRCVAVGSSDEHRPGTGFSPPVRFVRLDPGLDPPVRQHSTDGAVDLRAATGLVLAPGERASVPTGIAVALAPGWAGLIIPRSGLAARHGVSIVNAPGLVDAGYRDEIRVLLVNLGGEPVSFARGERVAQMAVIPVSLAAWVEVPDLVGLGGGDGRHGGFGSSGRH